ncbi:MAG: YqzL family protein [Bacilli bacterium]|nr:YqzL family protein [Bacilli bacterium]
MGDLSWKLFKETGDIKYYLFYLKIKGEENADKN